MQKSGIGLATPLVAMPDTRTKSLVSHADGPDHPEKSKEPNSELQREADLVCEALLREIERAKRWQTIKTAWGAIQTVRRQERRLIEDQMSDDAQLQQSESDSYIRDIRRQHAGG